MPTPPTNQKTFIYIALPCETKPLIDCYKLKINNNINAFSIYRNDDIVLTVTGIGKTAMAAGVAYTQALFADNQNPVLINIGIAGHQHHAIGSLFLADKITDGDTGRRYYPPLTFSPPCPTANLITFAKPQQTYPDNALCDMEAAGFYEAATRFTTGELCQSIKVVSDNAAFPAEHIQASQVSGLIHAQLASINHILAALRQLAAAMPVAYDKALFQLIVSRHRFTVSEQNQLKQLLIRCRALNSEINVNAATASARSGKEFLGLLNQSLNETPFSL